MELLFYIGFIKYTLSEMRGVYVAIRYICCVLWPFANILCFYIIKWNMIFTILNKNWYNFWAKKICISVLPFYCLYIIRFTNVDLPATKKRYLNVALVLTFLIYSLYSRLVAKMQWAQRNRACKAIVLCMTVNRYI